MISKVRLNIIHVITTLDLGGAENQLQHVLQCEGPNPISRVVIWLKGSGYLAESLRTLGIETINPVRKPWRLMSLFYKVYKLKKNSFRIIFHGHLPMGEVFATLLSYCCRSPLVVTKHNAEKFWPKGPDRISNYLAKLVHRRAAKIICISKGVVDSLDRFGEISNSLQKIQVIHYGYPSNGRPSKNARGQLKKRFRIGTLARLEAQKDIPTMIRAAERLKKANVEFEWIVLGEGSLRGKLEKEIKNRNVEDIFNLGSKTNEALTFLSSCDLFVLSSTYEGFGLVLLEALACELPIICSSTDASREIFGSGAPQLFLASDDKDLYMKIKDIMSSAELMKRNVEFGRIRFREFKIEKQIAQLRKLYDSI